MPESERNKIAIGASGLILGLTLSLAGIIYYKKKAGGQIRTQSETSSDQFRPIESNVHRSQHEFETSLEELR